MSNSVTPIALAIALVAIACATLPTTRDVGLSSPTATAPPSTAAASTSSPTLQQTPSPTIVPSPLPPVTECLLIQRELCGEAEVVHRTNAAGQVFTYLGFHLPPQTTITAPMRGDVWVEPAPFQGLEFGAVQLFWLDRLTRQFDRCPGPRLLILGDLRLLQPGGKNVPEGAPIAIVTSTGAVQPGGYNVTVSLSGDDGGRELTTEDLRGLFPRAFAQAGREFPFDAPSPGRTVVTSPVYADPLSAKELCPVVRLPAPHP